MAGEKSLILSVNQDSGEIVIALEVIEIVTGIAVSKIGGVYRMRGTFASNITELLGRIAHGKGVYLANEGGGLKVDLYCYLGYGILVPKVAIEV